ncbi:3,2-trans-enoyl-CoA isomerase [Rhizoctonia solani AG-1 IB]|uniref:3,2-trans-enoyl-CoA isomerase n=1 Tax=Thanatephorus cucumeris (strain AG1-IB / isolate 7/3/14) TaxID=1108050 RepID=M5BJM2_THACB|nr:3,2-trans-enoyl-CoA isomerase [Rhizoctonia solani AG-1 IB]
MPDVLVTIVQASGRAFCSGTDVGARQADADQKKSARRKALMLGMQSNTDLSDALSSHSKILVALLNGPAIGIAAAMLGHFDFVYAMHNDGIGQGD